MPTYQAREIDGQICFEKPVQEIVAEVEPGGALKVLSQLERITDQQRKWWKGVLLKHLAEDTGDSVHVWETRLKLAVMPDKFQPEYIAYGKQVFPFVPSITILKKKKMNEMITGAIAELHDEEKYGDRFVSYTLPERSLRKTFGIDSDLRR